MRCVGVHNHVMKSPCLSQDVLGYQVGPGPQVEIHCAMGFIIIVEIDNYLSGRMSLNVSIDTDRMNMVTRNAIVLSLKIDL